MTPKNLGIYIHVPFCESKCPYCDFYSRPPVGSGKDRNTFISEYAVGVKTRLAYYSELYSGRRVNTVYFGGGTPSVLGAEALIDILDSIKKNFCVSENAEITLEANPCSVDENFFRSVRAGGFNRLSMGLQSADENELRFLGRRHSAEEAAEAVRTAQNCGFDNISLDLMMGLPHQTEETLGKSIDFCASLGVQHISSYILKIEENTVFGKKGIQPLDDDSTGDLYLFACEKLKNLGYEHYEISNWCLPGFESRHNSSYWKNGDYLGIGPAAHSYVDGRRFYFDRNLRAFLDKEDPKDDGSGGDISERIMLGLRISDGISPESLGCNSELFDKLRKAAGLLPKNYINIRKNNISLTEEGFLVSNSIILFLLDRI